LDGKEVATLDFKAERTGTLTLPDVSDQLASGPHSVELEMVGGSAMPYSINVNYRSTLPASSERAPIAMLATLAEGKGPSTP
jgi:alpha-2-macroglobulin-like protein